MNHYKKYIAGFVFVISFLPIVASADTISDLQSQIQNLLNQIRTIQQQIMTIQASSTNPNASTTPIFGDNHHGGDKDNNQGENGWGDSKRFCIPVMRNLSIGSRGDDVREIQHMLATDPSIYTGTTTGYFGRETARGMARFQAKFGIASSTTGLVGPITRQFFNNRCQPGGQPNGGTGTTTPPFINGTIRTFDHGGQGYGDNNGDRRMMGSTTPPFPPMPPQNGAVMNGRGDR